MRTEFGISGTISMSQLYRGGGVVRSSGNVGGSVTTDAISFDSNGQDASGNVTSTKALGTSVASGDTFSSFTYSGAFRSKKSGGFSVPVTRVFFSNSSGTQVGSLLSQSAAAHNESQLTSYSTSVSGTTVSSNHVGATHITSQALDTGGQFREEDTRIQASVNAFTFTISQTRDANTSVPTSGNPISFSDLYGAVV